ncbi:MAG: hypothetical protein U0822_02755 [Anaerolineae bacterium]
MVSTEVSHRERLRHLLNQRFTFDEIQGIAFDLGVPDGERRTHTQLVLHMLIHLERHGRVDELLAWIGRHRSDLVSDLPTLSSAAARREDMRAVAQDHRRLKRLVRFVAIVVLAVLLGLAGIASYEGSGATVLPTLPPVETLRAAAYVPGLSPYTATPTPSLTTTVTPSPAPTETTTATPSPSVTASTTPTPTPTETPPPTETPTPRATRTPRPTRTPTETPEPTAEEPSAP